MQMRNKALLLVWLFGVYGCWAAKPVQSAITPQTVKVGGSADKKLLAIGVGALTALGAGWLLYHGIQRVPACDGWPLKYLPSWADGVVPSLALGSAYLATVGSAFLIGSGATYILANGSESMTVESEQPAVASVAPSAEEYKQLVVVRQAIWGDQLSSAATSPFTDEQLLANVRSLQEQQITPESAVVVLEVLKQQLEFYKEIGQLNTLGEQNLSLAKHRIDLLTKAFVLDPLRLAMERKRLGVDTGEESADTLPTSAK